jgi:hypothetical protein
MLVNIFWYIFFLNNRFSSMWRTALLAEFWYMYM